MSENEPRHHEGADYEPEKYTYVLRFRSRTMGDFSLGQFATDEEARAARDKKLEEYAGYVDCSLYKVVPGKTHGESEDGYRPAGRGRNEYVYVTPKEVSGDDEDDYPDDKPTKFTGKY